MSKPNVIKLPLGDATAIVGQALKGVKEMQPRLARELGSAATLNTQTQRVYKALQKVGMFLSDNVATTEQRDQFISAFSPLEQPTLSALFAKASRPAMTFDPKGGHGPGMP